MLESATTYMFTLDAEFWAKHYHHHSLTFFAVLTKLMPAKLSYYCVLSAHLTVEDCDSQLAPE